MLFVTLINEVYNDFYHYVLFLGFAFGNHFYFLLHFLFRLVDLADEEVLELEFEPLGVAVVGIAHAVCVGGCGGVAIGFAEDEDVALGGIVGQGEYYVVFYEVETLLMADVAEVVEYFGGQDDGKVSAVIKHVVRVADECVEG